MDDYRLQLGAYYGACRETGMNIDLACVILFIDGKDKPQEYWMEQYELDATHLVFVEKVKQYNELIKTEPA